MRSPAVPAAAAPAGIITHWRNNTCIRGGKHPPVQSRPTGPTDRPIGRPADLGRWLVSGRPHPASASGFQFRCRCPAPLSAGSCTSGETKTRTTDRPQSPPRTPVHPLTFGWNLRMNIVGVAAGLGVISSPRVGLFEWLGCMQQ